MKISGSNRIEIAVAAEHCRAVLLDFDEYHTWFPGVRESSAVPAPPEAPAGRLVFSAGIDLFPDIACVLSYDVTVSARLVPAVLEGELRIGGPGWHLQALDARRTLVSYEVEVEMSVPGGFLAERALSGPARRYLIEHPAEKLRERAEQTAA